jgi:hypothetical protein
MVDTIVYGFLFILALGSLTFTLTGLKSTRSLTVFKAERLPSLRSQTSTEGGT